MRKRRLWLYGTILIMVIGCPLIVSRLLVKPESATIQIRFIQPMAMEVFFMWGVNSWQVLPTANQPLGTVVRDGVMYTPMTRSDDVFTVAVTLTSGTTLNYGFLTTRTTNGDIVSLWEADGSGDFKRVVLGDGSTEHVAISTPEDDNPVATSTAASLLGVNIRTVQPQAGELFLVWGVNDWRVLPKPLQPAGTTVIDGIMHTPMKPEGLSYTVDLNFPAGATIDYGFLITRKRTGETIDSWQADGQNDFHIIINESGTLAHDSGANLSGITEAVRPLSPNWGLVILLGLLASTGILVWRRYPNHRPRDWRQTAVFFLACGMMLLIFLAIIRAYLLGFRWIALAISWVIVPAASVAVVYDLVHVISLTLFFLLILWSIRAQPQAQHILVAIFVCVVIFSLAFALINVQIFYLLGQPATYQLIFCTDILKNVDSQDAVANQIPLFSTALFITATAVLLVLAAWLERGISNRTPYTSRSRRVIWSTVMVALIAYLLLTPWLLAQHLWETKRLLNPIMIFAQSVINADRCTAFTNTEASLSPAEEFVLMDPVPSLLPYHSDVSVRNGFVFVLESISATDPQMYEDPYPVKLEPEAF
jgi:hypothetical protein